MADDLPIIVTLQVDEVSDSLFQTARQEYYPPAINYVNAHLTLFHNLPGVRFDSIMNEIARTCAAQPAFHLSVAEVMRLGRGVAYKIEAPPLLALRKTLAAKFKPWLTGQDAQNFRPHVTIQNKVSPEQASALYGKLKADFSPWQGMAQGLQLWFHEGGARPSGHWRPAGAIGFAPPLALSAERGS